MYHFTGYIPNASTGQPLKGALVKMFKSVDGSEQPLFQDESGTPAPLVMSDDNGKVDCWVPAGTYDVVYYYNGEPIATADKQQFVTDVSADIPLAIVSATQTFANPEDALSLPVNAEFVAGDRRYRRIAAAPGYEDMGDNAAPVSQARIKDATTSLAIFSSIQDALTYAWTNNIELLIPPGEYTTTTALAANAVRLRCLGPATFKYTGSAHINRLLTIVGTANVSVTGSELTVDANGKANIAIYIDNENASIRPDVNIKVRGINARMVAGNAFNGGAAGVIVRGRFGRVEGEIRSKNITRAAASGSPGVYGTNGGIIDRNSAGAALVVDLKIAEGVLITTDDLPDSNYCYDCDNFAVFQNDEPGASCKIDTLIAINHMGRAFKAQTYYPARVNKAIVHRSVAAIKDGATELAGQYSEIDIGSADISYSGDAALVHGTGTTIVSGYTAQSRAGYGTPSFQNIRVDDQTTGSQTINAVLLYYVGTSNAQPKSALISNITVLGKAVKYLVDIGPGGSSGLGTLDLRIDTVRAEITNSLIKCEASPTGLSALVSNVRNTGEATVPAIERPSVTLGARHGRLRDGGNNTGIQIWRGTGMPGLTPANVTFIDFSNISGEVPLYAGEVAAGEVVTLPPFAFPSILRVSVPTYGPSGEYSFTPSADTITTIRSAIGVVMGDGAEPASGVDFRIWRVGADVFVKNVGSARTIALWAVL